MFGDEAPKSLNEYMIIYSGSSVDLPSLQVEKDSRGLAGMTATPTPRDTVQLLAASQSSLGVPATYEQWPTRAVVAQSQWREQWLKMELATVWGPPQGRSICIEMRVAKGAWQTRFAMQGDWTYTLTHERPPVTMAAVG
jgi:hypothetical protein